MTADTIWIGEDDVVQPQASTSPRISFVPKAAGALLSDQKKAKEERENIEQNFVHAPQHALSPLLRKIWTEFNGLANQQPPAISQSNRHTEKV